MFKVFAFLVLITQSVWLVSGMAMSDAECEPSSCGKNTKCEVVDGRAICSCLPTFIGDPFKGCLHECEADVDCAKQQFCSKWECIEACTQCGKGAVCTRVVDHSAVCVCQEGYSGEPLKECLPAE